MAPRKPEAQARHNEHKRANKAAEKEAKRKAGGFLYEQNQNKGWLITRHKPSDSDVSQETFDELFAFFKIKKQKDFRLDSLSEAPKAVIERLDSERASAPKKHGRSERGWFRGEGYLLAKQLDHLRVGDAKKKKSHNQQHQERRKAKQARKAVATSEAEMQDAKTESMATVEEPEAMDTAEGTTKRQRRFERTKGFLAEKKKKVEEAGGTWVNKLEVEEKAVMSEPAD